MNKESVERLESVERFCQYSNELSQFTKDVASRIGRGSEAVLDSLQIDAESMVEMNKEWVRRLKTAQEDAHPEYMEGEVERTVRDNLPTRGQLDKVMALVVHHHLKGKQNANG
jgi:hypothetical protein